MRVTNSRFQFFSLVLCVLILGSGAKAATVHLWTGNGGNALWSNDANWSNGAPATGESGGTAVYFSSNRTSTMNIPNLVVDFIEFGGTNNVINGTTTLGVNGNVSTTNIQNDNGTNTIAATCPLKFTTNAAILVVVTTGTLNIASNISSAAGSNGLIVTNGTAGTLALSGAVNSYSGKTSVQSGLLTLNSSGANTAIPGALDIGRATGTPGTAIVRLLQGVEISDASDVTINMTGLLDMNDTADTFKSLTMVNGMLTQGASGSSNLIVAGATSLTDSKIAIQAGLLTLNGLSMNGGTITATSGSLKLNGDVTATATATSGAALQMGIGSLQLNASTRTFTVNPGASQPELKIQGVIANGNVANAGLKKSGTGTLDIISSVASSYSGTTTVDKGVMRLNTTNGHIINGPLIIGNNTDAAGSAILRELVQSNDLSPSTAATINSSGVFDLANEKDSLASLSGTGSVLLGTSAELIIGDSTNYTFGGKISGSGIVTKTGTGTMTLTAANTYTGQTVIADGELDLNHPGGPAILTSVQIGDSTGAANSASVVYFQDTQIPAASAIIIKSDGILNLNGKSATAPGLTIDGGSVAIGTGALTLQGTLAITGGSVTASTGVLNLKGDISAASGAAGAKFPQK